MKTFNPETDVLTQELDHYKKTHEGDFTLTQLINIIKHFDGFEHKNDDEARVAIRAHLNALTVMNTTKEVS